MKSIFEFRDLSEELDTLLTLPVVYRLTECEDRPEMLTLKGGFLLHDKDMSHTEDELWSVYITPSLKAIARICNCHSNILCCPPGYTSESQPGSRCAGFKQQLYVGGLMPVLLRAKYYAPTSGTVITISVMIGLDE